MAVNDLSFEIEEGHVYGFLGPNGAGKSTTMNIMTGCLSATEGHIWINGHDIFEEPEQAKKTMGYLPEQPPLYMNEPPVICTCQTYRPAISRKYFITKFGGSNPFEFFKLPHEMNLITVTTER